MRPENVPEALKARPQWVAWRWKWSLKHARWAKVPVNPRTGGHACSNKPATWATFDEALAAYRGSDSGLTGIGYMFSEDDRYTGVDGDACVDPETGRLAGEAEDAVFTLNSYTELSARGSGFHTIVEAEKPGDRCRGRLGDIGVEVYSHGRLFAFTGHRLPGTPATVESRQLELEAVYGLAFSQRQAPVPRHVGESVGSDAEVIARAESAKNGAKFKRLWAGDWSGYPSQSEADQALCRLLDYWTGGDPERMDRLFRQSGLYRDKWDRPESTYGTYGRRTISKVLGDA